MTQAYPLKWPDGWPRTPVSRRERGTRFRGNTFGRARDGLLYQLSILGATDVVISTDIETRLDGLPYAKSRIPDDPGVAIYFRYRGQSKAMARDAYIDPASNLRSLALAVEHLRGLDRHGGAVMVERAFAGFTALPSPAATGPWRPWWQVLDVTRDASFIAVREAYRAKVKANHPDAGGDSEALREIVDAWRDFQQERESK